MTLELTERLKSVCNLMAEKMPDRFKYNEQTIETLTTWTAWTFSIPNRSAIIFFNGKEIQTTQDSIDTFASLLPEPRRIYIYEPLFDSDWEKGKINWKHSGFKVIIYDMGWKEIIAKWTKLKEPLEAKTETFCTEVERQLGK